MVTRRHRRTASGNQRPDDGQADHFPFREYSTVFDSWTLRFAQTILGGLIIRQDRGGVRVVSLRVEPNEDALVTVVEHYGNESVPHRRVGYRLILSKLRRMTTDDDPRFAAGIYLEDLTDPWVPEGSEATDGVHWITRPPV